MKNIVSAILIVIIVLIVVAIGIEIQRLFEEYQHIQYCNQLNDSKWLSDKAEFVTNCMKYVM